MGIAFGLRQFALLPFLILFLAPWHRISRAYYVLAFLLSAMTWLSYFVYRGLRSFEPDDAGFFLELLPGPKNRDGLPLLVRFWKDEIESEKSNVPVGVIYGPSGCGKSSLVKAALNGFSARGLRLIEVDKSDLVDLPDIADLVADRPERFIIFCDDLSFEASEVAYKALKAVLDGSIAAPSDNLLVYATSNRRHLMPEYMHENLEYKHLGEEIHPGEGSEEKISLSERFGLWVSFYPFSQDEYLTIVAQWLTALGLPASQVDAARPEALVWALERGSRSGRIAYQFARDYVGRQGV